MRRSHQRNGRKSDEVKMRRSAGCSACAYFDVGSVLYRDTFGCLQTWKLCLQTRTYESLNTTYCTSFQCYHLLQLDEGEGDCLV
jgi:hypothetical protein